MINDMTDGSPARIISTFAIPMVLGNIFQQLYNTTDAIIVGRFVGKNALAAVGVANPIMSIAIFFIYGICIGASVLMAQLFGAGEHNKLKNEVSTGLIVGSIFSIIMSIFCVLLSKYFLLLMNTPHEILNDSDIYLKIVFSGLIFSFLYNFYSAAFRAIGDSGTPLIFLVISSVLNAILGITFIVVFKLGVAGSAIATVVAQCVSSILCVVYIYLKIPLISLKLKEFVIDKFLLKETIRYSWVSAIQQICLYIGRLLVQGVVNPFGTNAIAAYNAVTRVDAFMLTPADSFAAAVSTFSAQNKGAGKEERIIEGYKKGNLIIIIYSVITSLIIFSTSKSIMKLFVSGAEKDVISIGVKYLTTMSVFYVLAGICNIFQGLFRGVGKLPITLIATFLQIFLRVILAYALAPYFGIQSTCYSVIIGWIVMITYEGIQCRKYFRSNRVNTKEINTAK